jgi:epoxyqueuosine reductase
VDRTAATVTPVGTSTGDGDLHALSLDLVALGRRSGLAAVGVAGAAVFEETRQDLIERKRQGLHGGMQFTYRNPERSTDPGRIVEAAAALVVGAWSYRHSDPRPEDPPASDSPAEGASDPDPDPETAVAPHPLGQVARYARADHYASLRSALGKVADELRCRGWRAAVVCDDNALVDRAAAHRAGLGWFGKNSLLLLPGLGSWFVLGTVVTDAPLPSTAPVTLDANAHGCGSCTRCLSACPTGALVAPGVVDARRCLAWLVQATGSFPVEHREALGGRVYGCDECQQVCPINRAADRRDPPPPPGPDDEPWVPVLDVLDPEADDRGLMTTYGRWYIPARDPRYLRRNALVALGNIGDGRDPATERVLRHWLGAADAMMVEHARWAALRLGRQDLAEGLP